MQDPQVDWPSADEAFPVQMKMLPIYIMLSPLLSISNCFVLLVLESKIWSLQNFARKNFFKTFAPFASRQWILRSFLWFPIETVIFKRQCQYSSFFSWWIGGWERSGTAPPHVSLVSTWHHKPPLPGLPPPLIILQAIKIWTQTEEQKQVRPGNKGMKNSCRHFRHLNSHYYITSRYPVYTIANCINVKWKVSYRRAIPNVRYITSSRKVHFKIISVILFLALQAHPSCTIY